MHRAPPHQNFHSSNFIRVLSDLALVDSCEPERDFAEKLSQWLNLDDAIKLHAVHASGSTVLESESGSKQKVNLKEEFARLRSGLVRLDLPSMLIDPSHTRINFPATEIEIPKDDAVNYEPYRRQYLAHQRTMESSIRTFRVKVREVLARTSPTLAKLAALDTVFERALCERERQLLMRVPSLLEKRFKKLYQAHLQNLVHTQEIDHAVLEINGGYWLSHFHQELQVVVMAELDTRLEPTLGLIEAFNLEMTKHP